MRTIVILLLLILTSCTKKEEAKFQKPVKFQKINYSLEYDYLDSLGTKINPNNNYQYWQYVTIKQNYGDSKIKQTILKQGGDTLQRKSIIEKFDPLNPQGIFKGGHPSYRCNYAVTIENKKVKYIKTEDEFRTFLGTIDNLEEAMLLARTYGYILDDDIKGSEYRKVGDDFELHLMKFHNYPLSKESIEVKINRNGFIKTKSLGIYCEGRKCL